MIKKDSSKSREKAWWADALTMFARFSVLIAVPVVVASFLGNFLDKKYNTEPWLLLTCVGISFILTMIFLVRETMKIFREIEGNDKIK